MEEIVRLIKIEKEKIENYLIFKRYIPRLDMSKKFWFDFTGTELDTNAAITDNQYLGIGIIFLIKAIK